MSRTSIRTTLAAAPGAADAPSPHAGRARLSRRPVLGALAAAALVAAAGAPAGAAATPPALASGALGLSRSAIEATRGAGVGPFAGTGHYFDVRELYTYPAAGATTHVAYQTVAGQPVAVYVQIDWPAPGVTEAASRAAVAAAIPSDARLTELYWAPPTPGGPVALTINRYASAALGAAYGGVLAPEIVAIFHERWGAASAADATRVTSVDIAIRERTQATS